MNDPARPWLIAIAIVGCIATISGTLIYTYPETLGALIGPMRLSHEVSGDLSLILGVGYLNAHLRRVWRMKRRTASRWSGYVSIGAWIAAGATGVWGQISEMVAGSAAWWVHVVASIALIVVASFHGAWGFAPRLR